mmetsp:Transcript_15831/g.55109  ORF Transcript_15831/g.55109 Transcript_15831/m.55109 type:complete len:300 (+) Transcript_15831:36-935(+)
MATVLSTLESAGLQFTLVLSLTCLLLVWPKTCCLWMVLAPARQPRSQGRSANLEIGRPSQKRTRSLSQRSSSPAVAARRSSSALGTASACGPQSPWSARCARRVWWNLSDRQTSAAVVQSPAGSGACRCPSSRSQAVRRPSADAGGATAATALTARAEPLRSSSAPVRRSSERCCSCCRVPLQRRRARSLLPTGPSCCDCCRVRLRCGVRSLLPTGVGSRRAKGSWCGNPSLLQQLRRLLSTRALCLHCSMGRLGSTFRSTTLRGSAARGMHSLPWFVGPFSVEWWVDFRMRYYVCECP